jgi:hypothetical protein
VDLSSWYTFIPQKTDRATLFFIGAHGKWRSHFVLSQRKGNCVMMLKLFTSGDKGTIC